MSPKIIKAASDAVVGGAVRSFINVPQSGSEVADLIIQARRASLHEEANEIASAFDLARKKGEE